MLPVHLSKPPKNLGRFEVGAKIGGGGMATVYLGRDIRDDGSEALVALKVIRDELANDEQFTAMFIDEAKILARLSHPNVIQTLEYGVSGEHHFIAMELLNGRTVADAWDVVIATGTSFEYGLAAWICARVAEGLHSAHELVDETGSPLSVIHRDVNPSNIFLTHSGEVKLIDFGLARARVRVSKSAEGIVKGKIPYLAPEQAQGKPIDRRTDIYALGTTLWEMSSMRRLFKRDTDVDTLRAIRDAHVPDLRKDNPDFPEALWKIIDRALRTDADERYATAEEMRTDLDAFARATGPHGPKLSTLVSRLFPGGEARQAKWLHDAAHVKVPAEATLAPPAPVPMASSSLLEEDASPSAQRPPVLPTPLPPAPILSASVPPSGSPPSVPPPAGPRSVPPPSIMAATPPGKLPPVSTPPRRKSEAPPPVTAEPGPETRPDSDAKPEQDPESPPPSTPPPSEAAPLSSTTKRTRKKKRSKTPKTSKPPVQEPPVEDKRRLWMTVAGVVAILFVLALLATR